MVDFNPFSFGPVFRENIEADQAHEEQLSDAYHLTLGKNEVMVAYLLEIAFKEGVAPRPPRRPA